MSLNVSEVLIQQSAAGDVDELALVETIRPSLPYAWNIVEKQAREQFLRIVGGDAIRGAVERHFTLM